MSKGGKQSEKKMKETKVRKVKRNKMKGTKESKVSEEENLSRQMFELKATCSDNS